MIYLTGSLRKNQIPALVDLGVGVMLQPENYYATRVEGWGFPAWAADNGCFNQGAAFDDRKFYRFLDTVPRSRLLFVAAPDVLGDAAATRERSHPYLQTFLSMGLPRAFVAQNGIDRAGAPWDDFEWLFLGGDDEFKLGPVARQFVVEAHGHGKRVHMGRVNSNRRLLYATNIGCDSADGTFLAFRNRAGDGTADVAKWFRQKGLFDAR